MPQTPDIIDPVTAATIAGLFRERVRRTPHAGAYQRYNEEKQEYETFTWKEMSMLAARWQAAFERDGLRPGDRVAVIVKNCVEWVLFDLASLGLGLVTVPIFAEDRVENIIYILKQTGARFVLVDNAAQWLRLEESGAQMPEIERVVALNRESLPHPAAYDREQGRRAPYISDLASWLPEKDKGYVISRREPMDLATIVYTSGTTGNPKGVMLSHSNILTNAFACLEGESIYRSDLFLSFLPLSHTFERTVGYYIPMMAGARVAYVRSIDKLAEDLLQVRPTVLISVPRIYERIHRKIVDGLEMKPALFRRIFRLTVHTGWRRFLRLQGRARWSPLFLLWPLLNRIIAKRLIRLLGGRLRLSISGGAPLSFSIARIFIGLRLNLLQGYGMTETSPVISVNTTRDNDPLTVGRPVQWLESAIAADGELLVRGPNIMMGYWRDGDATDAVIDEEEFLHTGDVARMDKNGHLAIVGRKKEIIVLSNGEKVPPEDLELAIAVNPLFEQVMVVGEGRPYLAALVVLNRRRWEKLAQKHSVPSDRHEVLSGEDAENILLEEIARMITRFPGYARIRRIHASLSLWKMQDGLITSTLKLRRKQLLEKFSEEVERLYEGH
jgi:long-chain acyl-CoA synthetase